MDKVAQAIDKLHTPYPNSHYKILLTEEEANYILSELARLRAELQSANEFILFIRSQQK
jgi:hypothetical protein